ncbi:WYL domain-containing protein [Streptomyces sp. NRRL S-146]|uniref:WYL domain-containing protein n=1 Tax=Streptomyces sp. NRRL S-146 TaxID=1463884 RepID=UPI0004C73121|nr:hypothetical protein [Streptomyces sp. NRRL S-146]
MAGTHPADPLADAFESHRDRIELRFRSPQAAETLLAFGPDAEVLCPEDLRRALARRAACRQHASERAPSAEVADGARSVCW